jgi:hypothetical protein
MDKGARAPLIRFAVIGLVWEAVGLPLMPPDSVLIWRWT